MVFMPLVTKVSMTFSHWFASVALLVLFMLVVFILIPYTTRVVLIDDSTERPPLRDTLLMIILGVGVFAVTLYAGAFVTLQWVLEPLQTNREISTFSITPKINEQDMSTDRRAI